MTPSLPSEHPKLLGVVLCGGRSKRMGRDKARLCNNQGKTYLSIAIERLQAVCANVCLSANDERQSDYPIVRDQHQAIGPIDGICSSLQFAREAKYDGCLFTPVDTPELTVADLRKLSDAFRRSPAQMVCAVSDQRADRLEPLIAIYPTSSVSLFEQAIDAHRFGLQALLADHSPLRVTLSSASCRNINTPDDLMSS